MSRPRAPKGHPKSQKPLYTIGVLADTHVPDRVGELHPLILPSLRRARVTHIFHAGDICSSAVLTQLGEVAPVTAVRGNRDWFVPGLPLVVETEIGGVQIALMHGHGGFARYLVDKARYLISGYNLRRYLKLLTHTAPNASVIIFGHTHYPESIWLREKLLLNPGSASFGVEKMHVPTIAYLYIFQDGSVKPKLQYLRGYKIVKRRWIRQIGTYIS